jgi:Spy/CpxP family protein refolding chaperone
MIAAATAAFLAATAAPALADDYPPCTQPGQDHCRVVVGHMGHHRDHHHHHHHDKH